MYPSILKMKSAGSSRKWYPYTQTAVSQTQKTVIFTVTAMKTSNHP